MTWELHVGDCREVLRSLPAGSVHTCVTSPPYFGLRDYGTGEWDGGDESCDHLPSMGYAAGLSSSTLGGGKKTTAHQQTGFGLACGKCGAARVDEQIGLEPTPDEFVAALVGVFREVRRVLRDDGTVWLNLGDSYASQPGKGDNVPQTMRGSTPAYPSGAGHRSRALDGVKPKDLIGIPWMVAFALRADGWYLRSDIIWAKPNPMPESVTDRPTKAHEYLFLLSKGPRYFYDADAIREGLADPDRESDSYANTVSRLPDALGGAFVPGGYKRPASGMRNKRSVWTVATQPYPGAHFATFPPKLIEPCILAGAPERACGECGAPWTRVVETVANGNGIECPKDAVAWDARQAVVSGGPLSGSRLHGQYHDVRRETRGFEPSCTHNAEPVPGVVLDPFAGAGTTGVVALRHNRDFVGIELNAEYADLARPRLERYWRDEGRQEEAPQIETLFTFGDAA